MGLYVGADIGATHTKIIGIDTAGQIEQKKTVETHDSIPDTSRKIDYWLNSIRTAVEGVAEESSMLLSGVGIAAPGLVASDELSIAHMPGRMEGLASLNWTEQLEYKEAVPVINDAQAALLAESWIGAAGDVTNAVLLTLGSGVGGAVMIDGRVLRGPNGRAGHIGHMALDLDGSPDICGMSGSLEELVGELSLPRRSRGRFERYDQLLEAYRGGDIHARELWLRSVRALATGIASIINIVDPEAVVLGGGVSAAEELAEPLRAFMNELEWRPGRTEVPVRTAQLGSYGGAIGAARRAMTYRRDESKISSTVEPRVSQRRNGE
jgi:glucokinase